MMKLISFGDSWAQGAELNRDEQPFIYWLADYYNCEYINFGQNGMSMGLVNKCILDNSNNISQDDIVTVVIPPDIRWYTENNGDWNTLTKENNEWKQMISNGKTIEWFKYHHNLFIINIILVLKLIGCKFVLMHNYGLLELQYENLINKKYFLSIDNSLTGLLNGNNNFDWNYDCEFFDDGPHNTFSGKYFEGKQFHPNELGHKRIAELLIEHFNKEK